MNEPPPETVRLTLAAPAARVRRRIRSVLGGGCGRCAAPAALALLGLHGGRLRLDARCLACFAAKEETKSG